MNEPNETENFNDGKNLPLITDKDYTQKPVIVFNQTNNNNNNNNNSHSSNVKDKNNSYNDFRMDMRLNGSRQNTEADPLTGQNSFIESHQNEEQSTRLKWRNKIASTNFFMVVFLLAYVLQGCYFTYFVSVITTIEKLFQVKSATIALLLNFSEVGQISTSLLLTYYAGRGHRPRWIACGMLLFSIAAFGSVSPHFIYGDRLYSQHNAMSSEVTQNSLDQNISSKIDLSGLNLCITENLFNNNKTELSSEFMK